MQPPVFFANAATDIATQFGLDAPHFIAQVISFSILAFLLHRLAYKPILAVLEDPTEPVCQDDTPIPGDVVAYVLSSYQGTAYTLLLEGLRRQTLQGQLMTITEWATKKQEQDDSAGVEEPSPAEEPSAEETA